MGYEINNSWCDYIYIYKNHDVCLIHEPKNSGIVYSIIFTVFPTVWDESFTNNHSSPTSW